MRKERSYTHIVSYRNDVGQAVVHEIQVLAFLIIVWIAGLVVKRAWNDWGLGSSL